MENVNSLPGEPRLEDGALKAFGALENMDEDSAATSVPDERQEEVEVQEREPKRVRRPPRTFTYDQLGQPSY